MLKGAKNLKPLCIATIIGNGIFLAILIKAGVEGHMNGFDMAMLVLVAIGNLAAILYPGMILSIQRKYYTRHTLDAAPPKILLTTLLVMQLLFTAMVALVLITGLIDTISHYKNSIGGTARYFILGAIVLFTLMVVANLVTAIKGTKFTRSIRQNFVDDIMDSFDS